MKYWIFKSEPDVYGIDHLKEDKKTTWDGVRNYQVRNMMRDLMKKGDQVYFYHSSTKIPGIYGLCEITKEAFADPSQFDPKSQYFDSKSKSEDPRWLMVEVKFKKKFKKPLTLTEMKSRKDLSHLKILQRGNRLSITELSKNDFDLIAKSLS